MRRTDFLRRKQTCRNSVTHLAQFSGNFIESKFEVTRNVFEKAECRAYLANNSGDVRPKVPLVIAAAPPSCHAEWLARVTANDAIHQATPRAAVEGSDIRPNRRRIQPSRFHAVDQRFDGR